MPIKTIHVAHSPDSDDAFMFYALAEGKIDTGDLRYVHELQDIESLNQRALKAELEVTAVSIHAYAYLTDRYALLPHGSSMGDRYGPRLVARTPMSKAEVRGKRIAIPGPLTTAYLAMQLYEPNFEAVMTPFDEIEDAVVNGDVDAGLLIHEGQLTFGDRGLHLIADMGEWWFQETGLPLATRRQRRAQGHGRGPHSHGVAPPAREHRLRARAPRQGTRPRDAVLARTRSRQS
jgi:1,4-dihydroxy-6-naphthoate synthase